MTPKQILDEYEECHQRVEAVSSLCSTLRQEKPSAPFGGPDFSALVYQIYDCDRALHALNNTYLRTLYMRIPAPQVDAVMGAHQLLVDAATDARRVAVDELLSWEGRLPPVDDSSSQSSP